MFNNRISRQPVSHNQDNVDAVTFARLRNKNLNQRIINKHDKSIKELNNKVDNFIATFEPNNQFKEISDECEKQKIMLSDYEGKILKLVAYIKRLEQGLESVKSLLVNKTNTADTSSAPVVNEVAPVVEAAAPVVEASAPVVEEAAPVVEEAAPVESVEEVQKESENEVDEKVALEIVDEEKV